MQKQDNIELRSEEVQEILSRPPHALVRYGITIICFVILVLIIGSFIFKYPDMLGGMVTVTTENPPVWMEAKSQGSIQNILCTDKEVVDSGKPLLVFDNSAVSDDVFRLQALLKQIKISGSTVFVPESFTQNNYRLGDIQMSYSKFVVSLVDYQTNKNVEGLRLSLNDLQAQIAQWMESNVLVSPQKGTVYLMPTCKKNQNVSVGESLLAVMPQHPGNYIGIVTLPVNGSGKIKAGQQVNIKLFEYPYLEFGMLKAKVLMKSFTADGRYCIVKVGIPNGLHTTTGKNLEFAGKLSGTAEIITENVSLFRRLFSPLKYISQ